MGIIESAEEHSTNVNYKINDGTASIHCTVWNDKDPSGAPGKYSEIRENSFVKIVGKLVEYEGKKTIQIYDIKPIGDWNELTHHLYQIIFVHLQNTKGPIPGTAPQSNNRGQNQNQGTPSCKSAGLEIRLRD
jgi:replication factor A2